MGVGCCLVDLDRPDGLFCQLEFFSVFVDCQAAALSGVVVWLLSIIDGEFDSGSGRTLAACLTHASRTVISSLLG